MCKTKVLPRLVPSVGFKEKISSLWVALKWLNYAYVSSYQLPSTVCITFYKDISLKVTFWGTWMYGEGHASFHILTYIFPLLNIFPSSSFWALALEQEMHTAQNQIGVSSLSYVKSYYDIGKQLHSLKFKTFPLQIRLNNLSGPFLPSYKSKIFLPNHFKMFCNVCSFPVAIR